MNRFYITLILAFAPLLALAQYPFEPGEDLVCVSEIDNDGFQPTGLVKTSLWTGVAWRNYAIPPHTAYSRPNEYLECPVGYHPVYPYGVVAKQVYVPAPTVVRVPIVVGPPIREREVIVRSRPSLIPFFRPRVNVTIRERGWW